MADLLLKELDDRLMSGLKLRAETLGRSVEEVARNALELGLAADAEGRAAVAKRIRDMTPGPITDDSTDIIRRLRDGG
jgi:plasmid stability protein